MRSRKTSFREIMEGTCDKKTSRLAIRHGRYTTRRGGLALLGLTRMGALIWIDWNPFRQRYFYRVSGYTQDGSDLDLKGWRLLAFCFFAFLAVSGDYGPA